LTDVTLVCTEIVTLPQVALKFPSFDFVFAVERQNPKNRQKRKASALAL
jgi:hypothetical protein